MFIIAATHLDLYFHKIILEVYTWKLIKSGCLWHGEDEEWGQDREENISLHTVMSILNFLPVHIIYLKYNFSNLVH